MEKRNKNIAPDEEIRCDIYYSSTVGASTAFFFTDSMPFMHPAIALQPSLTAIICPLEAFRRKRLCLFLYYKFTQCNLLCIVIKILYNNR